MPAAGSLRGSHDLFAIVLAAGASTRFGSPKQLVRIAGRPLLHAAVTRAAEIAGNALLVVLGSGAAELAPLLKHSAGTIVINQEWREGLASSVRAAIAKLPGTCAGALLMPADQPAVSVEDLKRLAGAWRRQPLHIAASVHEGGLGLPAIWPRSLFPELLRLRGDAGLRLLLRRHAERVVRVAMPSAAIDIDTPEDLLAVEAER
jgi:molybdenum cofactor cytidylyltransferase